MDTSPLKIPQEMITEIAFGVKPAVWIAQQYGIVSTEFRQLEQQDWFRRAVEKKRATIKVEGVPLKTKAGIYTEDMADRVYKRLKDSDNVPLMIEFLKYMAKLAGLEQAAAAPVVGTGFSININMGEPKVAPYANATVREYQQEAIEVAAETLPPMPVFLTHLPYQSLHTANKDYA
jgi:hypothetical protein